MSHRETIPQKSSEVNSNDRQPDTSPMMVYLPIDVEGANKIEESLNREVVEGTATRRVIVYRPTPIKNSPSDK